MMPAPFHGTDDLTTDRATANLIHPGLEHRHFRTPGTLRRISQAVCLLITLSVAAGYLVTVDKLVEAAGYLETDARLFPVRSPVDGRIAAIAVREDEPVQAGQPLVTLDGEETRLRVEQQEAEIDQIVNEHYRLAAELQSLLPDALSHQRSVPTLPDTTPPTDTSLYRQQILDTRRARELAIEDLESQLGAARGQFTVLTERVDLAATQLRKTQALVSSGARSDSQQRDARSDWLTLRMEKDRQSGNMEELRHAIAAERARLLAWQTNAGSEHKARLQQLATDYRQARAELVRRENLLKEHQIVAPVDGLVSALEVRGRDELVSRGDTLLQLRPSFRQEQLYLEIRIPARDAVWVEPGMTFRAVAAGSPAEDHGVLHGTIDWLTAIDPESDAEQSGIYRARGQVQRIEGGVNGQPSSLDRPGLQLRVSIQTGQRRLLNYLIDPFAEHLRMAWTEPS